MLNIATSVTSSDFDPAQPRSVDFRRLDGLSAVLAVLITAASLGGLLLPQLYRDNTWSRASFRGNDLATLLFVLPVLVVALLLARRGSVRARLIWFAGLAFNVYNYAFYFFGTAFNDFFLLYAALLALSGGLLIAAVPPIGRLAEQFTVPRARLVAGYLVFVGAMFAVLWVADSVRYLVTDTLPRTIPQSGIHTSIVYALDLTLVIPALITAGVLLWRRRPWGAVLGVVMSVLALLYMLSLAIAGAFQADAGIAGASWTTPPYIELAATSVVAAVALLRRRRAVPRTAGSGSMPV